jgi:hypothetical protein
MFQACRNWIGVPMPDKAAIGQILADPRILRCWYTKGWPVEQSGHEPLAPAQYHGFPAQQMNTLTPSIPPTLTITIGAPLSPEHSSQGLLPPSRLACLEGSVTTPLLKVHTRHLPVWTASSHTRFLRLGVIAQLLNAHLQSHA